MKHLISDITQWTALSLLVAERWQKRKTPFMVIIKAAPKTHVQLGYFHSTVLPIFTAIMYDSGEIAKKTEKHAKYYIKRGIGYGEWIDFDGGKVFVPESFEKANIEELSEAIDFCINEVSLRGGYVPPPINLTTGEN